MVIRGKRALIALLSGLVLAVGLAGSASATERANVSLSECIARHDFTEFFRNFSSTDKYCYDSGGPNQAIYIGLDHVTWFHAGVNDGWFEFRDGADGRWKTADFRAGADTGCTDCFVTWLYLYP
jgi:hypothetical protein